MIILADNNLRGAVKTIHDLMQCDWPEYIAAYDLSFLQLEDLGLDARSKDSEIYLKCIEVDAILVTSDKTTDHGEDSLENVIRRYCRDNSPPVVTVTNQVRVLKEPDYQKQCVIDLLDCISDIDNRRGIGRLHIPYKWPGASQ